MKTILVAGFVEDALSGLSKDYLLSFSDLPLDQAEEWYEDIRREYGEVAVASPLYGDDHTLWIRTRYQTVLNICEGYYSPEENRKVAVWLHLGISPVLYMRALPW